MFKKSIIAAGMALVAAPALAQAVEQNADMVPPMASEAHNAAPHGAVQLPTDADPNAQAASPEAPVFDWGSHIDTADDRGVVTPGKIQLAGPLGVDPAAFTTAELVDMFARQIDGV
ncbi:hypothetical protein ACFQXB_02345 [Plastorhodobacter daqingensis]|uniref:Uncharacterized protein n=1 Tax=Plastorhodobacter daqingensis TaxID=1387281 RepID=A0ABW2UED0_9RHOB